MTSLTRLTELEAVNNMLSIIGQAPVNSLSGALPLDATFALNILREVSRNVQFKGYHFNTLKDITLNPEVGTGYLKVPTNYVTVDYNYGPEDFILEGDKLYDRLNNTNVFTQSYKVDVILYKDFEVLPEPARQYIYVRAARQLQDRRKGSDSAHQYTLADEIEAKASFLDYEGEQSDANIFNGYASYKVIERGGPGVDAY